MMAKEEDLDFVEKEVDRRMRRLRSDPGARKRYGFGAESEMEKAQWSEIRRVVTLEVQTELQRRDKEQLADGEEALGEQESDVLENRFELRRQIGRGAQGRTYLGFDRQTEKKVAVKELLLRDVADWKAIELFEREGQALKFLDHRGIPAYVDAFHIDDGGSERFFLVQEFVDGSDFKTLIDQGLSIDEEEAKQVLEELLTILVYLQNRSPPVIHRDIKPSNIMRRGDGSLALIDFGAVQSVIPNEKGGSTIIGTSGYMPMEQLMGRAGPATDIYATGVTVIHLLSRRHPTELPIEDWRLQFEDVVNISPRFTGYLSKMIAPKAEKRFSNAEEALKELRALERPEPTPEPTPAPMPEPPRPPAPRSTSTDSSSTTDGSWSQPTSRPPPDLGSLTTSRFEFLSVLNPMENEQALIWYSVTFCLVFGFLLFFGWPLYITWQDSKAESAVERGDLETAMEYRQKACNAGATRACAYLAAVAIEIEPELAEESARDACDSNIALGCANYADIFLRRYTQSGSSTHLRDAWRYAEQGCSGTRSRDGESRAESDTGCARLALAELYRGNPDEAQRAAMRAVGINDGQPYPHKALGVTLVIEGDVESAMHSFDDATVAAKNPQGREHPILTRPLTEIAASRLESLAPYYPERREEISEAISRLQ